MKKLFFIFLLCFTVLFGMFAIDMSPHPGDTLETVFTVQDDVVIMSQAEISPAYDNILYLEQFNSENEICVSTEANDKTLNPYYFMDFLSAYDAVAVSYIGYEMENIFIQPGYDVAIYKTEFG